jgi:ATP dependent DNA ligase domain
VYEEDYHEQAAETQLLSLAEDRAQGVGRRRGPGDAAGPGGPRDAVRLIPVLWHPTKKRPPGFVEPCIPILASRPPAGPQWVHEIKHDGYRLIARKRDGRVRLFTRRGYNWSDRHPRIVAAVASLPASSATIDGEAVYAASAADSTGSTIGGSSFSGLVDPGRDRPHPHQVGRIGLVAKPARIVARRQNDAHPVMNVRDQLIWPPW